MSAEVGCPGSERVLSHFGGLYKGDNNVCLSLSSGAVQRSLNKA